eukprot:gene24739-biopygen7419
MRIPCVGGGAAGPACRLSVCAQFSAENPGFLNPDFHSFQLYGHRSALFRNAEKGDAMPQHCAFQRVFYDFICGVFHLRVMAQRLGGWGGPASLPKITKCISSDGQTKKVASRI